MGYASWAALACQDDYPLAATFCDDWCRTTLQANCGEEPDNCIRECELTRADGECFEHQKRLLSCYETADREVFSCVGRDFDVEVRVSPDTCQTERDRLYECEAPGIGSCLEACRTLQDEQFGGVVESETGLIEYSALFEGDGGLSSSCPVLSEPCENSCWALYAFSSVGLASAGVDVDLPQSGAPLEDASLGESSALACVQQALLQCLVPEVLDAGVDQNEDGERIRTIDTVISECTGRVFDGD